MDCHSAPIHSNKAIELKCTQSVPPLRLLSAKELLLLLLLLLATVTLHHAIEWVCADRALGLISLHALHVHTHVHPAHWLLLVHLHAHRLEASTLHRLLVLLMLLLWLLLL